MTTATKAETLKECRQSVMDSIMLYDVKGIKTLITNGLFPKTLYRMEIDSVDLRALYIWNCLKDEISRFTAWEYQEVKTAIYDLTH